MVSPLFGMLLRHSPNNVCYSRIVRSASIPNNIHVTLVMLAHAFLTTICSQGKAPAYIPSSTLSTLDTSSTLPALSVAPLTVPEVRHLLGHLIWPLPCSTMLILSWSWWRRCHR